jgi:hypothetical protein
MVVTVIELVEMSRDTPLVLLCHPFWVGSGLWPLVIIISSLRDFVVHEKSASLPKNELRSISKLAH